MAISGLVLFVFVVVHVIQMRFGPSVEAGYTATLNNQTIRDLYRLVIETFKNPLWVGFYVAGMIAVGMHVRHGFWSMFQSMGVMNKRMTPCFYRLGTLFAIIVALGFITIPVVLFIKNGGI